MESLGVISKVDEPTPWCAPIVVVPKKSEAVRICVDLQMLNMSVMREAYPLPSVDETLAQLSGAKMPIVDSGRSLSCRIHVVSYLHHSIWVLLLQ